MEPWVHGALLPKEDNDENAKEQACVHAGAWPGVKSLLYSAATLSFSWKFSMKYQDTEKEVKLPENKAALQILVNRGALKRSWLTFF